MEERSLRIYQEKTFFSKISNTITKILTPTKIGINGMLISIKRNNALKAYETYKANENIENQEKQEATEKKFEDVYALYLESIDKYIMDALQEGGYIENDNVNNYIEARYITAERDKENPRCKFIITEVLNE